jgi:hypothetical protein
VLIDSLPAGGGLPVIITKVFARGQRRCTAILRHGACARSAIFWGVPSDIQKKNTNPG